MPTLHDTDQEETMIPAMTPRSRIVPTWLEGIVCAALATCVLTSGTHAQEASQASQGSLDHTRSILDRWVETRQLISREKRDWMLGKEILNDRIGIVTREITTLRSRIGDAEKSVTEAEGLRADLEQQNRELKETSSVLAQTVANLESRTKALLVRLPDPIRDRVKTASQQIPADPEETKLSLSERFQNVVGILNEVNKFHREITVTTEVRTLADGTKAEVTVLYVGIAKAYYVSSKGDAAGTGTATDQGFVWTEANASAPHIQSAIAILKNEQAARFVPLPIRIL